MSTIASLYDPLGFLSPFILLGRSILQEMCRDRLDWDDPLPDRLEQRWSLWVADLLTVERVQIPRNYVPSDFGAVTSVELHHFSDASTVGYGQSSYLRFADGQENIHCTLVFAKARVTPLKPVTIPRLELQAAVLSVKVARFLEEELDFENITHFFWSDSEIVLAYLHNESKRFHIFVANRVQQILQFSRASQWSHVASEENPADHASRGLKIDDILTTNWLHGPTFLRQSNVSHEQDFFSIPDNDVEVKFCKSTTTTETFFTTFEKRAQRFSTKQSLIRGVAVIVRRCALSHDRTLTKLQSLEIAEKKYVSCIQRESFASPTAALRSTFRQLNCYKDENDILRVGGRTSRSLEPQDSLHPMVLPRDSFFSVLIARDCHVRIAHQGRSFTINEIRARGYWILGIRHVVSALIRSCVRCLRLRAPPEGQLMADLPSERVEPSPPFTHCGLDCFGPFHVKDGRKNVKRYGLIVTCLASRAVHLEVLDDMTTDSFINGLRNVIAIRGTIQQIRCDRGTNFVGASRDFRQAWREMDKDAIATSMLEKTCEFVFNPPAASHMGGVWERQIRTVRNVLSGLLLGSGLRLSTSSLRTFLYEVMAIVNSRPLSAESLESPDGPRPLTPNHILTMKSSPILPPPGVFDDPDLYVRRRWRRVQRLAEEFWRIWQRQYLTTQQYRRKWQRPRRNLQVGDVVVLHEEGVSRMSWRLARINETYPSGDGLVRSIRLVMTIPPPDRRGRLVMAR
ncbi:MAG: hypothetical protein KAG26_09250, partial [Methylococcales bacterium]|nr:hypothetical protein [Methylococcales bacterium]